MNRDAEFRAKMTEQGLEIAEMILNLGSSSIGHRPVDDEPRSSEPFRSQFLVPGGKNPERTLDVVWQDGRIELDRDTEIAIDILCEYIANALDALQEESRPSRALGPRT